MIKAPSPNVDFANLSFVPVKTNGIYLSHYRNGAWDAGGMQEGDTVTVHALSTGINYGQQAFEGMKCYRRTDGGIQFFRPEENALRFQRSCRRLAMPELPVERFLEAIEEAVRYNSEFVPPHDTKATLYVRPFMIGVGSNLVLAPSKEYLFGVVTMPVGLFFKSGLKPVDFVTTDYDRAAANGTGSVKVGGNYAASMLPNAIAKSQGFADCLYLDPLTHTKIDEGGAANFFAVTKDGVFVTPKSSSILPSVTKLSLLYLARERLGMKIEEREVYVDRLDEFSEAATCGTAAIITPIAAITHRGVRHAFPWEKDAGPWSKKLYDLLVGIQFGDVEAPDGWIRNVE
ncbi:MAG: branched-chain amino acid aminotransferase [Candidatus Izemoplasmatales bacterium]